MPLKIDLLTIERGTVTAPAGCGKTQLIADALSRYGGVKPILVLTHTNAGVAALRSRLERAGVPAKRYRVSTIDGWAMRLISTFPARAAIHPDILKLATPRTDYPAIRSAAGSLLQAGHVDDVIQASFSRLIVDEYQDCGAAQHAVVCALAELLPTCVLGDPLQAVFGFRGQPVVDWNSDVGSQFPFSGELDTPWRWANAGEEAFGRWLLECRATLLAGGTIDLSAAPANVKWVPLDGSDDYAAQLKACQTKSPTADGKILILGDSTSPPGQRDYASRTPGAVTVESVDLGDLVTFARQLDLTATTALSIIVGFAASVMTNVGANDFLARVDALARNTARKPPTDAERAALNFVATPTHAGVAAILSEISRQGGVRTHRPAILRGCFDMLRQCQAPHNLHPSDAAVRVREQSRLVGRPLAKRTVGSTLLLKGLEAEVAVILNPSVMTREHLYVAMTRGSHALVICSASQQLRAAAR